MFSSLRGGTGEIDIKSNVYKLVAELVVIIIGVLIALAVDAWWDHVREQQLEQQSLSSLASDLSDAVNTANALEKRDSLIVDLAQQVGRQDSLSLGKLRMRDVGDLFSTAPDVIRLRTYEELHNSGQLRVISNRELRLLLSDFDAQARRLASYDSQMAVQWNETARPILFRTIQFESLQARPEQQEQHQAVVGKTELDLIALRNAIIDRGNFASVHRSLLKSLSVLISELQDQTGTALEAVR